MIHFPAQVLFFLSRRVFRRLMPDLKIDQKEVARRGLKTKVVKQALPNQPPSTGRPLVTPG